MTSNSHSSNRLCWTALGTQMGFTNNAQQRAEILAAIDHMTWIHTPARPPYLDGAAVRAIVNAVFHHRRDQLRLLGVAKLPGGRQLIGLEDSFGTRSYVLDLLNGEAIYVLAQFAHPIATPRRMTALWGSSAKERPRHDRPRRLQHVPEPSPPTVSPTPTATAGNLRFCQWHGRHRLPTMNGVARRCPRCGFTGRYRTAALADAYLARHSCDRQRRRDAAARARAERGAGGPRRECLHAGHPHQHGTRPAYVKDRCRCLNCRAANAAASRRRDRDLTYGRWSPFMPAKPVRAHINALREAGIGRMQIARLAGVSPRHLGVILNGVGGHVQRSVRADTAARILAVQADAANRAPHRHVEGTGTRRRLQALIALGWPQSWLADQLGRHSSNLRRALYSEQVTARTAEEVRTLFERLWSTRPPQDTPRRQRAVADALRLATRSRWLTPLAWDDIDHDPEPPTPPSEAGAEIDEIAIELALTSRCVQLNQLTPAEQAVAVRRLTERGNSVRDIAERLATSTRTVSRRRRGSAA